MFISSYQTVTCSAIMLLFLACLVNGAAIEGSGTKASDGSAQPDIFSIFGFPGLPLPFLKPVGEGLAPVTQAISKAIGTVPGANQVMQQVGSVTSQISEIANPAQVMGAISNPANMLGGLNLGQLMQGMNPGQALGLGGRSARNS